MGKPKVKADIDALYTENDIQDANYATKDVATKSSNGLMSSTDKTKLDNIDGSSSGTVTSVATGTGLTGGAITSTGTIKANLNSETSLGTLGTTSKLYAVGVDSNDKLAVNVPWTDTTYSTATTSADGLMSSADKTKLDSALTSHQDISGKENTGNKVTSISSSSTDTQYPSAKCVYDLVGNIESLLEALL